MKPLEAGDPASVGDGRYRLVGRLGRGGMGVVYFGRSRSGRAVAVKVVRPELSTEPGFRRRFADEVAAARRVGGFHTAPVVDADPEGDPAWLVTAYVPGPTLQAVLERVGPLPADTLTVLAAGLAEALAAIHQAGVIHRDLKPANIIVAEDGPRVIDFGIARALDGTALTQTGFQIGTLGFLAPEQLTGGTLTPAVDMFALGVVLGQAAGRAPFGDGGSAAWPYRVVHEQPELAGVPGQLRDLVAACLAKDPRERPTPTEFLDRLTVEHPTDVWLPAEATALVRSQEAGAYGVGVDRGPGAQAAPTDPRTGTGGPPGAGEWAPEAPVIAEAPTAAPAFDERPPEVSRPRTVQSSPDPGFGPRPGYSPGPGFGPAPVFPPTPAPGAPGGAGTVPVGGGPTAGADGGPGRRRAAVVATALVMAVAAGVLVWHPWTGSGSGSGSGGDKGAAGGSASSSPRATAAAFPDAPLLVRMDTDPGSSTCHSVIGRRDSTRDDPKQLIAGTCDALPQWSPDHRTFAFTRTTGQESAVWTANADGTDVRRVAAIEGGRVSWSPDGKRLAVLRRQDGVQQLFAVTVADGSAQQLTTGTAKVEDPAWSPDGKHIAICLQKTSGWQIHVVDPSRPGAEPQQITHQSRRALDPVWSPDGKYFAYTAGAPNVGTGGDIHIVRTDGTGDRTLVQTAAQEMDPVWSPDGKWVAFVRGPFDQPAVWAVRADGTGARRLTTGSTPEGHPSWR
ncbi:protein kinase [Streptomyces sp. NPDC096013]|uniref:protein kinase domain-containing protein n=1 Tax=Streptomyces sp. NPDC096013 TaxID=3366069 RepID=UPI00382AAAF1